MQFLLYNYSNCLLMIRLRYEETMVNSIAFTTFVINVAMEGLCEKYGDEVNLDRQNWVILKNKKYLGTLQRHHIQQVRKYFGSFTIYTWD